MKKILIVLFLSSSFLYAKKNCKSRCVKPVGASNFTYSYTWQVADDALCTIVPHKGQTCQYTIAMNGVIFESGTIDGGQAVTC